MLEFYKKKPSDTIYWVVDPAVRGTQAISFDKKHIYHLFGDYPDKMSEEEVRIFDKENPTWAELLKERKNK